MYLVDCARRYISASNEHDLDSVERLFAGDVKYVSEREGTFAGRAAIRAMMDDLFSDFPDACWTAGYYRAVGSDAVAYDFLLTATSSKTGEAIERTGVERIYFDKGGKIRRIEVDT